MKQSTTTKIKNWFKKHKGSIIVVIIVIVLSGGGGFYIANTMNQEPEHKEKISELSLKDIGTLSTQEAYVTVVETMNNARQILGKDIPGTQSICIFSHDFEITAGYNFSEIQTKVTEKTEASKGIITVYLPEAQILTNGIVADKEEVYYENESIFNNLSEEDKANLRAEMSKKAEQQAIDNGILDSAKENAKKVLSPFIYNLFSSEDYEIVYDTATE